MKKVIAENGLWCAYQNPDGTAWAVVSTGDKTVGIFRDGGFKSLYPLTINEMLTVISLMLRVHLVEQSEENVLKTKNDENGG